MAEMHTLTGGKLDPEHASLADLLAAMRIVLGQLAPGDTTVLLDRAVLDALVRRLAESGTLITTMVGLDAKTRREGEGQ